MFHTKQSRAFQFTFHYKLLCSLYNYIHVLLATLHIYHMVSCGKKPHLPVDRTSICSYNCQSQAAPVAWCSRASNSSFSLPPFCLFFLIWTTHSGCASQSLAFSTSCVIQFGSQQFIWQWRCGEKEGLHTGCSIGNLWWNHAQHAGRPALNCVCGCTGGLQLPWSAYNLGKFCCSSCVCGYSRVFFIQPGLLHCFALVVAYVLSIQPSLPYLGLL